MVDFKEPEIDFGAGGPAVPSGPPNPDNAAPEADGPAPFGLKVDGTPRKSNRGRRPGPARAAAPRPRATPRAKAKAEPGRPDYRAALGMLIHLPVGIMSVAARGIRDERRRTAVQLDAMTLTVHGPALAEALARTAEQNARLAAALDKIVKVGPYGEVIAAVAPIALQIAANHHVVEAGSVPGTMTAEQLVNAVSAAA
jgi:hypothetical protein